MKIKHKFGVGFIIVFLCSFSMLNFFINKSFNKYINSQIKFDMESVYKSSYRIIKQYFQQNDLESNETIFNKVVPEIATNISEENDCQVDIFNSSFQNSYSYKMSNGDLYKNPEKLKEALERAGDDNSIFNMYVNKEILTAEITFPIYVDGSYLSTMSLTKDFTEYYKNLQNLINLWKAVTVIIFLIMLIATYILSSKIVKPLEKLKVLFKKVEKGDFNIHSDIKSSDEIGDLSLGFNNMKDRIKEQIETISEEKDKVIALEKNRTEFFNNVTHELKTPLTTISGYTQIIGEHGFNDEEFKSFALERIDKESQRMHNMVVELINISKENSELEDEKRVIVQLDKYIDTIVKDLSIRCNKSSINILCNLEEIEIKCIEDDLKKLIINILDNAVKYSTPNSEIKVSLFKENNSVALEVKNYSDNINKEAIDKIFEPFYRVDTEKSRRVGGNGLGLYICSLIAYKHNWNIEFNYDDNISEVSVKFNLY